MTTNEEKGEPRKAFRFHAEIFALSERRSKWLRLEANLVEVSVWKVEERPIGTLLPPEFFRVQAVTAYSEVVLDSRLLPGTLLTS